MLKEYKNNYIANKLLPAAGKGSVWVVVLTKNEVEGPYEKSDADSEEAPVDHVRLIEQE